MSDFELVGYEEQMKMLRGMMTDDPGFKKRMQAAIKKIFNEVRKEVSSRAKGAVPNDPRKAYMAVRTSVYKRILGGQVNILNQRKAGAPGSYMKPTSGHSGRGGNRWGRSERTKDIEGYGGKDRGFILRFVNEGAGVRGARTINSYTDSGGVTHSLRSGGGNRGRITGRNWFSAASTTALEKAAVELEVLVEQAIKGEFV